MDDYKRELVRYLRDMRLLRGFVGTRSKPAMLVASCKEWLVDGEEEQ